jgi:hypothetical protein
MKNIKLITASVASLLGAAATSQAQITLNFASTTTGETTGSQIEFDSGGSFHFDLGTPSGADFVIGASSIGSGVGDTGVIGGTFQIGTPILLGILAPVTGAGTISINDGLGTATSDYLTANLHWNDISQIGTGGTLNFSGTINLMNISYTGTQTALQALVNAGGAVDTIGYTFSSPETLNQLSNLSSPLETSFAGSIAAVPEPTTIIAGAMMLLPFGASTLRSLRKNRTV